MLNQLILLWGFIALAFTTLFILYVVIRGVMGAIKQYRAHAVLDLGGLGFIVLLSLVTLPLLGMVTVGVWVEYLAPQLF